jgi:hypothetical protein
MTDGTWVGYLRGKKVRGPLSLFPRIDAPVSLEDQGEMERDRFMWLREVQEKTPDALYNLWTNRNLLLDERHTSKVEKLEDFYAASEVFGYHLLREEIHQFDYLRSLRDCLRLRLAPGEPVVFVGPTAGGDLEVIHDAGGFPILVPLIPESRWSEITTLKMFETRVPFEDGTLKQLVQQAWGARFIIISSWCTEPQTYLRLAVESIGKYGFIVSPATNLIVLHEAKQLSLHVVDTFQREVGIFYKPVSVNDVAL